ncbi:winged helix-turn-helix domain-containing protein [Streptomyces bacillaris]
MKRCALRPRRCSGRGCGRRRWPAGYGCRGSRPTPGTPPWRQGGSAALASKGAGGFPCRLDDAQAEELQVELEAGPAAHGWLEDQRWTLARVAELIHRLFGHRYTPRGVSYLLHRLGWSPQVPAHRAVERNEEAVAAWRTEQWSRVRGRPSSWARG